jgi:hypothetical protein
MILNIIVPIVEKRLTKKEVMARWKKETSQIQRPLVLDCIIADEIVYNAYKVGFIGWNVYNLGRERIKRTMNGTWMFKNPDKKS